MRLFVALLTMRKDMHAISPAKNMTNKNRIAVTVIIMMIMIFWLNDLERAERLVRVSRGINSCSHEASNQIPKDLQTFTE